MRDKDAARPSQQGSVNVHRDRLRRRWRNGRRPRHDSRGWFFSEDYPAKQVPRGPANLGVTLPRLGDRNMVFIEPDGVRPYAGMG
jgi:hypothetical protein